MALDRPADARRGGAGGVCRRNARRGRRARLARGAAAGLDGRDRGVHAAVLSVRRAQVPAHHARVWLRAAARRQHRRVDDRLLLLGRDARGRGRPAVSGAAHASPRHPDRHGHVRHLHGLQPVEHRARDARHRGHVPVRRQARGAERGVDSRAGIRSVRARGAAVTRAALGHFSKADVLVRHGVHPLAVQAPPVRPPGRGPRGGRRQVARLRGGVSRRVRRRHPAPRQARRGARARAAAVHGIYVGRLLHVPRLRSARRAVLAGHGHAGAAVHRGKLLSHAGRVRREREHVLPRLLAAVRRLSDDRHAHLASGVVLSHDRAGLHRRRGRARDAAPYRTA